MPLVALALAACGGDTIDWSRVAAEARATTPTYSAQIEPLLRENCVECHTRHGLRAGGVELDLYESARSTAQHNACVSISEELIAQFAGALRAPLRERPGGGPCGDWKVFGMPPGASSKLSPYEQALLARWIEVGAPR